MTNAILIGDTIYSKLMGTTAITSVIGTKAFPLVAPSGTTFPFVIYTREGIQPSTRTKDGWVGDGTVFRIDVVAASYAEGVHLANEIRKIFEVRYLTEDGLLLYETYLSNISESWDTDCYIQQLRFTTVVFDAPEQEPQSNDNQNVMGN